MPDLPNDNADSPSDQPGDDFESRTIAMTEQLDRITAETNEFIAKREREDHAAAIRKPLHAMLAKIGFDQSEYRECERAVGGLQNFAVDPETDELTMNFGGVTVRARDVLADHPGLTGLLRRISTSRSDDTKRVREIDQLESRLKELQAQNRQHPLGSRGLHEVQTISNRLRELREAAPVEEKAIGVVDTKLIQRRKTLIADRERIQLEFRRSGGRRDDLLIRADKLTREINALSAQIAAQQGG